MAGPLVAQLLQQAVAHQAAAEGTEVTTVDVVATPANDPRGSGFASSVLPLTLAGTAADATVTLVGLRGGARDRRTGRGRRAGRPGRHRDRAQLAGRARRPLVGRGPAY